MTTADALKIALVHTGGVPLLERCPAFRDHDPDRVRLLGLSLNEAGWRLPIFKPQIIVLDTAGYGGDGAWLVWSLQRDYAPVDLMLVVEREDEMDLLRHLTAGAKGYLRRSELDAWWQPACRALAAGQAWIPRHLAVALVDRLSAPRTQ